jgi:predicted GTPase
MLLRSPWQPAPISASWDLTPEFEIQETRCSGLCGPNRHWKSPASQFVVDYLSRQGLRVAVVRHPIPYGDLVRMEVQCFREYNDFSKYAATVEEREEYEPYVRKGVSIRAGADYYKILRKGEQKADVIIWAGGNNDIPFFRADLHITLADPHRPGHEIA